MDRRKQGDDVHDGDEDLHVRGPPPSLNSHHCLYHVLSSSCPSPCSHYYPYDHNYSCSSYDVHKEEVSSYNHTMHGETKGQLQNGHANRRCVCADMTGKMMDSERCFCFNPIHHRHLHRYHCTSHITITITGTRYVELSA